MEENTLADSIAVGVPRNPDKALNAIRQSNGLTVEVADGEIMDAQNSFTVKANIVADILNNIQSLYKVANKREIVKIQDEFYRIYRIGDLDQLRHFNKELDIIAEGYRAQVSG